MFKTSLQLSLPLVLAAGMALTGAAHAEVITYSFTAASYNLGPGDDTAGATVVGTFTVDTSVPDSQSAPNNGNYFNAGGISASVSGGVQNGVSYANDPANWGVSDGQSGDPWQHFYSFYDLVSAWPKLAIDLMSFANPDAILSEALPTSLNLGLFEYNANVRVYDQTGSRDYRITSLSSDYAPTHRVPTPGTMPLLLIAALFAWGAARRGGFEGIR